MDYRIYDPIRDAEAARRIWREVGWLQDGKDMEAGVSSLLEAGRAHVALVAGEPECCVSTAPGTIAYLDAELPFACVTSVTTSRVARRQGLAARLAAEAISQAAAQGAAIVGLSVFDQGFYDRLGFGTGCYEHEVSFDPAQLKVAAKSRPPIRLSISDGAALHAARLRRRRGHGTCNLTPAGMTIADMHLTRNAFGLGYRDAGTGDVTHYLWFDAKDVSHGPYSATAVVYRDWNDLLELLGVIASLADQVHLVTIREPAYFHLQDLLDQPFRQRRVTEDSKYEGNIVAAAYWQMRISNLPACLAATLLPEADLAFNLRLNDPVEDLLSPESTWRGCGGHYVVNLGSASSAVPGEQPDLPLLTASVGAFTRLWLGVLPATSLAASDRLEAPPALLRDLDKTFSLPRPCPDWDF